MSSLLIFSPKCKHSMQTIDFIQKNHQLKAMVKYHNVNELGVPHQYRDRIKSVPTLLTSNGKLLVGSEVIQWLDSLLPQEITSCDLSSGLGLCSLTDESGNDNLFSLDSYGQSLQPAMTPELEAKIKQNVSEAYNQGSGGR